jgi:transposase
MRTGDRTTHKRRWTPVRKRPPYTLKIGYQYTYLYLGVNPKEGKIFALILPDMTGASYEIFLEEFSKYIGKEEVLLIVDNVPSHKSKNIKIPDNIVLEKLPPYSPELNPVERIFEEIRKDMSNKIFEGIEEVEDYLIEILKKYFENPKLVKKLTLYPYIREAISSETNYGATLY